MSIPINTTTKNRGYDLSQVTATPNRNQCLLLLIDVLAKKVTPEITSTNTIAEGGDNTITLDVPIKFQDAMDTTGVSGTDLWKLSAWASATPDGRSQR